MITQMSKNTKIMLKYDPLPSGRLTQQQHPLFLFNSSYSPSRDQIDQIHFLISSSY